jgi:hypothetical protein
MEVLLMVLAVGLLFLGRKLFWLFVGGLGMVAGFDIATRMLHIQPFWLSLVISLLMGLAGLVIAMEMDRAALTAVGFLAGGMSAVGLLRVLQMDGGRVTWIAFGIGAVLGILLIAILFDWAIILLSALYGASLIGNLSPFASTGTLILIASMFVFGVTGQVILLYSERRAVGRLS